MFNPVYTPDVRGNTCIHKSPSQMYGFCDNIKRAQRSNAVGIVGLPGGNANQFAVSARRLYVKKIKKSVYIKDTGNLDGKRDTFKHLDYCIRNFSCTSECRPLTQIDVIKVYRDEFE